MTSIHTARCPFRVCVVGLVELTGRALRGLAVQVGDDDPRLLGREPVRAGATDPGPAAGHEDDATGEPVPGRLTRHRHTEAYAS